MQLVASCIPFVLGIIGYYQYYESKALSAVPPSSDVIKIILNAMYSSIRLYGLSYDAVESKYVTSMAYIFLELARWLALAATTSVFVSIFRSITIQLRNYIKSMLYKSVALHGDAALLSTFKRDFGGLAIIGDTPGVFRANTHIIAFEKEESLFRYLNDHLRDITWLSTMDPQKPSAVSSVQRIYLCTQSAKRTVCMDGRITISNIAENCARLYWNRYWLHKNENVVVFIGAGCFCINLLKQALLVNVFSDHTPIEYHVFANAVDFLSLFPGISHFVSINQTDPAKDALFFHTNPYEQNTDLLARANRVILCDQSDEQNHKCLDIITDHRLAHRVDIRARDQHVISLLWPTHVNDTIQINPFGMDAEIYNRHVICEEHLLRNAKLIHARYLFLQRNGSDPCGNCKNDPIRCVSCPKFEPLWNALSSFIQGSNIAQADHLEVKIREVCCKDIEVTPDVVRGYTQCYEQLPQSRKMRLWKMEHDRWCRYMYIHGWEYAPVRDNSAKKHPLLVPFEQLDEHEWNKDAGAFFDVPKLIET